MHIGQGALTGGNLKSAIRAGDAESPSEVHPASCTPLAYWSSAAGSDPAPEAYEDRDGDKSLAVLETCSPESVQASLSAKVDRHCYRAPSIKSKVLLVSKAFA